MAYLPRISASKAGPRSLWSLPSRRLVQKRTVPAKRKSAVPAKHAVPSHETALEDRTGHWIERIEPRGTALLSKTLGPIYFVIKNRSPNGVFLMAEYGDLMDLPPGKVRATYAAGTVARREQE